MSDKYKDIFFLCNFLMRFSVNFFHKAGGFVDDGGVIDAGKGVANWRCKIKSRQFLSEQGTVALDKTG